VIEFTDLVTIGLLVVLEGVLSADNALVLAVLVLPLPPDEQRKALRYGILGAFVLRSVACLFAAALIRSHWMKLVGGLYLLYLVVKHFWPRPANSHGPATGPTRVFGLSPFWSTVVKVELTDLVFAIDSILMAVGMSKKLWVIITGGLLGILAIRLLTGKLLAVIERYPAIVDGAYIIIAWIGAKLLVEYFHAIDLIDLQIPKLVSLLVIILLFGASVFYARARPSPVPDTPEASRAAEELLEERREA
jgi:YkoY family integral membrane protein